MMSEVKGMVDGIIAGDLTAATASFNAALDAKRTAEWENVKTHFANTAFETPEIETVPLPGETAGIDTGITGDPAELEAQEPVDVQIGEPAEEEE